MSRYPKPHPQTAGRVIDGEAVLILADDSQINVLNRVGSRVFELADGSRSVAEIVKTITAEFEVDFAQAQRDVIDFLMELAEQNVMVLGETQE
jgi:hypothetical protein